MSQRSLARLATVLMTAAFVTGGVGLCYFFYPLILSKTAFAANADAREHVLVLLGKTAFWLLVSAHVPIFAVVYLELRYPKPSEAPRCPKCGYDLRATPDRCPECGTPAKK